MTLTKPLANEIWARNQSTGIIEWLSGNNSLPDGFPELLDIWVTDSNKKRVSQITRGDPSINARWVFDSTHRVPTDMPDGSYFIQLVNSQVDTDVAYSKMIQIKGGTPFKSANTKSANSTAPNTKKRYTTASSSSIETVCIFMMLINYI